MTARWWWRLLVNAIEQNPNCVLLLDEIEKAHPDVFNILLQVMDDGKLTNSAGKSVPFRNVILIMTSNAGATAMEKPGLGFGTSVRTGDDEAQSRRCSRRSSATGSMPSCRSSAPEGAHPAHRREVRQQPAENGFGTGC
jgi:MoxR-like ATPase